MAQPPSCGPGNGAGSTILACDHLGTTPAQQGTLQPFQLIGSRDGKQVPKGGTYTWNQSSRAPFPSASGRPNPITQDSNGGPCPRYSRRQGSVT